MEKLIEYRNKIDEIDKKIIELYEKRMDIVKNVVEYKLENKMEITDSSREEVMLQKNLKLIKNEEYKSYYKKILTGYLQASKEMQKDIMENGKDIKNV